MATEPVTKDVTAPEATTTIVEAPITDEHVLYCANHPNVETRLRCNRCNKPICLKCAVLTDVGYRCRECIRGVQAKYFNAVPTDNLVAFVVGMIVAAMAAPIATRILGLFFFWGFILAVMLGGAAGGVLAQIIRSAIGRRRGRYLPYFALAGIIVGILIGNFIALFIIPGPLFNLQLLIFAFLAVGTAYRLLR
jgi:hypothetical protein